MTLESVRHYVTTNTLEVVWVQPVLDAEGALVETVRAKCTSYSSEQRAEFVEDTGLPAYADLAEW